MICTIFIQIHLFYTQPRFAWSAKALFNYQKSLLEEQISWPFSWKSPSASW